MEEDDFRKFTLATINLIDNTLADNRLAKRCPLDNGRVTGSAQHDLGTLDCLPFELLHNILVELDLRTLTSFRRVSRRALSTVDHLFEYRTIVKHSPNLLRGVLSIQSDQWITRKTLYQALCTAECETCGDIGGYVYVLTGCRVCFLCLSRRPNYLPIPFGRAARLFKTSRRVLQEVPYMISLPGIYAPNEKVYRRAQYLTDFRALHTIVRGSSNCLAVEAWNLLYGETHYIEPAERFARSSSSHGDRSQLYEMCSRSYDAQSANALRYVAIVQSPFLHSTSQTIESGFFCIACQTSSAETPVHFRRRFVKSSFQEHWSQCHIGWISTDMQYEFS